MNIERTLLETARKAVTYRYHRHHRENALHLLSSIEQEKGKTDPKLLALSDEYAQDALGWRGYAPWLYTYSAFSGEFKTGWIPDNYYGKVVLPKLKGDYGALSALKGLNSTIFPGHAFADIARYGNGIFCTSDGTFIDPNNLRKYLFEATERIVFKTDATERGEGIFFFNETTFDADNVRQLGNGVFQRYVDQHELLEAFMPTSVATLRMTTVIEDDGNCSVRACILRFARNNDTHVNAHTEICLPIDPKDGRFANEAFLPNWQTIEQHPDTGISFAGNIFPQYEQCVSIVTKLHKRLPAARCVGWDVIVNKSNGIELLEWDGQHNGIKCTEASQGPCFADLGWENLWR
jgi:hypothetical protein